MADSRRVGVTAEGPEVACAAIARFADSSQACYAARSRAVDARELFPVLDAGKTIKVNTITLLARCSNAGIYAMRMAPTLPAPPPAGSDVMPLTRLNQYGALHGGS